MNLHEIFYYDGKDLRNKIMRNPMALADTLVGCIGGDGYRRVQVNKKGYQVHRLIWEMFNGEIPEGYEIDHVNHIRDDNRLENLRLVSRQDNRRNQAKSPKNTSGVIGVSRYNPRNKWQAQIKLNGKNIHLGFYDDFNDAVKVRKAKEMELGFHANHGKGVTKYAR